MTRFQLRNTNISFQIAARQQSVAESFQRAQPWPSDHKTAALGTRRIAEMIAIDMQPFTVVEDEGFRRVIKAFAPQYVMPSRKYFSQTMIPNLYTKVKDAMLTLIEDQVSMAFTVDIWTAKHTTKSYIGLTCHWISNVFERKMAVLHCQPFVGHHSALNIKKTWEDMMTTWNIPRDKCYVVISDSAANMVKTFTDLNINRISCFAHTIQLALKDGMISQRSIVDTCAVARSLVGHFRHSSSAMDRLGDIQTDLGLPVHKLIQDVATRWSSTHDMLERLVEQRRALTVYASESEDKRLTLPTPNQWQLMESACILLKQFAQLTLDVCRSDASISYAIPALAAITCFLKSQSETDIQSTAGANTMRAELVKALEKRFGSIHTNAYYVVATGLDPRFKLRYFTVEAVEFCKSEIAKMVPQPPPVPPPTVVVASSDNTPSVKRAKVCSFRDCFEMATVSTTADESSPTTCTATGTFNSGVQLVANF